MIQVDFEHLRTAAREGYQVADAVAMAQDASAAALPWDAFGLMCSSLFLPSYKLTQGATDLMLAATGPAIESAARALAVTADDLEEQERATQARFDQSGSAL